MKSFFAEWGPAINFVGPTLVGWLWWSVRQKFCQKEEHAALAGRVAKLEQNMPDEGTMLALQLGIQEMRGEFRAFDARMEGLQDSVGAIRTNLDMLMQHHLDGGR